MYVMNIGQNRFISFQKHMTWFDPFIIGILLAKQMK